MKIQEVKDNLNKAVNYDGSKYYFTGCTLRKNESGFVYQAELTDVKRKDSLVIARLEDISPYKIAEVEGRNG